MLNKNLYPLLKLIQEHKYLSSEDINEIIEIIIDEIPTTIAVIDIIL